MAVSLRELRPLVKDIALELWSDNRFESAGFYDSVTNYVDRYAIAELMQDEPARGEDYIPLFIEALEDEAEFINEDGSPFYPLGYVVEWDRDDHGEMLAKSFPDVYSEHLFNAGHVFEDEADQRDVALLWTEVDLVRGDINAFIEALKDSQK